MTCKCTADTFSRLVSLAIVNDDAIATQPLTAGRENTDNWYLWGHRNFCSGSSMLFLRSRIPHCKVAGIVLGNTRNERSHRAMRTIYNDMCTYADRNNAFLPIFLAPSVHVYGSGCRVDIYGSGRYRLVEAAWDILYTRIFWRLSLQCV